MVGVGEMTIVNWERDKHRPTLWRKERLERLVGESLEEKI